MRMHRMLAALLGVAILLPAGLGSTEPARSEVERSREAHAFSRTVMSPFCPGRTLTDCPSPDAAAMREEIREQLDSGVSKDAIRSELERLYGAAVVSEPRSAWAWIIPLGILGAGLAGLVAAFRSLKRRAPEPVPAARPELARELDADLDSHGL